MSDIDEAQDALFEALTIDRQFQDPVRPHYYTRGKLWQDWWGGAFGPKDVVYFKAGEENPRKKVMHRIYGPAYVSQKYDIEAWYKDGKFHRIGGPAYRHKNNYVWFKDGELHRLDGPAVNVAGHPKEYWIGGQQLSPKEYRKEIERRNRKGVKK